MERSKKIKMYSLIGIGLDLLGIIIACFISWKAAVVMCSFSLASTIMGRIVNKIMKKNDTLEGIDLLNLKEDKEAVTVIPCGEGKPIPKDIPQEPKTAAPRAINKSKKKVIAKKTN